MSFGNQLRKLVKSRGLNFTSLAKKMDVSTAYISQIAIGIRKPVRMTLQKLSKALEVPVDTLLRLGEVGFKDNSVHRKIPVLHEAGFIAWMSSSELECPALFADSFEYASNGDPRAFYMQPSDSNGTVFEYDLVLIEPMAAIKNGDTILACFQGIISLGKIVIADGIALLFNDRQEHLLSPKENNIEDLTLFRAVQGIKNI